MHALPHHYAVTAGGQADIGDVRLTSAAVPPLVSAPPAEFDGPGDRWSPETLLVSAVGSCLVLTFRAVARASALSWIALQCDVDGTLDKVDGVMQFTHLRIHARLDIPSTTPPDRAGRLLERAERACLISSSLKATTQLTFELNVVPTPPELAAHR